MLEMTMMVIMVITIIIIVMMMMMAHFHHLGGKAWFGMNAGGVHVVGAERDAASMPREESAGSARYLVLGTLLLDTEEYSRGGDGSEENKHAYPTPSTERILLLSRLCHLHEWFLPNKKKANVNNAAAAPISRSLWVLGSTFHLLLISKRAPPAKEFPPSPAPSGTSKNKHPYGTTHPVSPVASLGISILIIDGVRRLGPLLHLRHLDLTPTQRSKTKNATSKKMPQG